MRCVTVVYTMLLNLFHPSPTAAVKNVLGPISLHAALGCAPDWCKKCCWTHFALGCPSAAVKKCFRTYFAFGRAGRLQKTLLDLFLFTSHFDAKEMLLDLFRSQ